MSNLTIDHEDGLLTLSTTYPMPPEKEIPLDSTVTALARRFCPGSESAIVVGPVGSGKTIHLSQFSRQFPNQCFTYFLANNFWVQQQSSFLYSLCYQMNSAIGNSPIEDSLDVDRMKTLFSNLVQKTIEKAKREKKEFYFVVDGLEHAFFGSPGDRIIDLLPLPTHRHGLYFLGGARPDTADRLSFDFRKEEPHLFSFLETRTYLSTLEFDQDDLRRIHDISEGYPGYLSVVRDLILRGHILEQILNISSEVEGLLGFQWDESGIIDNKELEMLFGIIAFSLIPLSFKEIVDIIEYEHIFVKDALMKTGLVRLSNNDTIEFQNELLRRIAHKRLTSLKTSVISVLIKYYEQKQNGSSTSLLRTQYYFEIKDLATRQFSEEVRKEV